MFAVGPVEVVKLTASTHPTFTSHLYHHAIRLRIVRGRVRDRKRPQATPLEIPSGDSARGVL